ncbi:putative signal peptide protein [Puccinia sorghi]|uniref:Putative signal peptide protein n=1 Tax=Puccinia sorghi TaxID=27349 RepID=A0A0L6VRL5_9BASI|nr:putative signal peptide protein [Puccinia sorghi]
MLLSFCLFPSSVYLLPPTSFYLCPSQPSSLHLSRSLFSFSFISSLLTRSNILCGCVFTCLYRNNKLLVSNLIIKYINLYLYACNILPFEYIHCLFPERLFLQQHTVLREWKDGQCMRKRTEKKEKGEENGNPMGNYIQICHRGQKKKAKLNSKCCGLFSHTLSFHMHIAYCFSIHCIKFLCLGAGINPSICDTTFGDISYIFYFNKECYDRRLIFLQSAQEELERVTQLDNKDRKPRWLPRYRLSVLVAMERNIRPLLVLYNEVVVNMGFGYCVRKTLRKRIEVSPESTYVLKYQNLFSSFGDEKGWGVFLLFLPLYNHPLSIIFSCYISSTYFSFILCCNYLTLRPSIFISSSHHPLLWALVNTHQAYSTMHLQKTVRVSTHACPDFDSRCPLIIPSVCYLKFDELFITLACPDPEDTFLCLLWPAQCSACTMPSAEAAAATRCHPFAYKIPTPILNPVPKCLHCLRLHQKSRPVRCSQAHPGATWTECSRTHCRCSFRPSGARPNPPCGSHPSNSSRRRLPGSELTPLLSATLTPSPSTLPPPRPHCNTRWTSLPQPTTQD